MSLYSGITLPGKPDLENVRRLDLLPIPMLRRMHRYGMAIDIPYLHDLSTRLGNELDDYRERIAEYIPLEKLDGFMARQSEDDDTWSPINIDSGDQIASLLYDCLGIGRGKQLKRTPTGDRIATGKKQLEILKKEHPVIQLILDYKERAKLKNTYTDKLPNIARLHVRSKECGICGLPHDGATYRIHSDIPTTRTDTGRFASRNPNLQNIPVRTLLGRLVRAGFIASPGTVLLSRDFSQIELRLLAHLAQDPTLIDIFIRREDPHTRTAMEAFGITDPAQVDKLLHRAPCKNVNFGIVYGLTEIGLYDQMALTYATAGLPLPPHITPEWCAGFIEDWHGVYKQVRPYMEQQYYRARRYGCVWDMFGRTRLVPEARSIHSWIQSAGMRQAGNMPIQASCAGLMKLVMGELEERLTQCGTLLGIWVWPLMTIHDELLFEIEEDYADAVNQIVGDVMDEVLNDKLTGQLLCRVPIESDGKIMTRWVKE